MIKKILQSLCRDGGISGSETELTDTIREWMDGFTAVTTDNGGNIIAAMGDVHAAKHILIDAHIDRIGLIVTYINGRLPQSGTGRRY